MDIKAERENIRKFDPQEHYYCSTLLNEIEKLQAKNKKLRERIEFAVDYLPECPDKAKSFLVTASKKG